eukprot:gene10474-21849_t
MYFSSTTRSSRENVSGGIKAEILNVNSFLMSFVKRKGWQNHSEKSQPVDKPITRVNSETLKQPGHHKRIVERSLPPGLIMSSGKNRQRSGSWSRTAIGAVQPEPEKPNTNRDFKPLPSIIRRNSTDRQRTPTNSTSSNNSNIQIITTSTAIPIQVTSTNTNNNTTKPLCCDKCDGKHETSNCPYYKKNRDNHPDAQKSRSIGGTSTLPGAYYPNARVIRQPGDGSCLFHSLSYGLRDGSLAHALRSEICSFIERNPDIEISETPLKDWVKWDAGVTVSDYARRMSRGAWGGGIEMATVSRLKKVNVHVYERSANGFKRISAFDHPECPEGRKTTLLYPVEKRKINTSTSTSTFSKQIQRLLTTLHSLKAYSRKDSNEIFDSFLIVSLHLK